MEYAIRRKFLFLPNSSQNGNYELFAHSWAFSLSVHETLPGGPPEFSKVIFAEILKHASQNILFTYTIRTTAESSVVRSC